MTDIDDADLDGTDDYLDKSPSAGRMGKAVEYLVAASCILTTRGELNVSTSLVDDEGVDLVFNRRNSSATLAVQVKSRTSDSKRVKAGTFLAFVRSQTFRPRPGLDMLFVAVDIDQAVVMNAWLVPSEAYEANAGKPNKRGQYRFYASMKDNARDKWLRYRLTAAELAPRVLKRLGQLAADV